MKFIVLHSSLIAAVVFFYMVTKELHRNARVQFCNKSNGLLYYPD